MSESFSSDALVRKLRNKCDLHQYMTERRKYPMHDSLQ